MTDPMELVGRLDFYAKEAAETNCPNTARDLTEAAACIRELVEGEQEIAFEVWEGSDLVAASNDEADGRRYAAIYSQDGPVRLLRAVTYRSPLPPAPGAEDE